MIWQRCDHLPVKLRDKTRAFRRGNELCGAHCSSLRVLPSQQCLGAYQPRLLLERVLRLVDQREPVADGQSLLERLRQAHLAQRFLVQRLVELRRLVSTRRLGTVHRDVGLADQLLRVVPVFRCDHNTKARSEADPLAFENFPRRKSPPTCSGAARVRIRYDPAYAARPARRACLKDQSNYQSQPADSRMTRDQKGAGQEER